MTPELACIFAFFGIPAMSSRSQPREGCVLRILSLGIAHLEHLHFAGPVLVLKAIVVLPAHESEWLLRVESVRCAVLTPNAQAHLLPEAAAKRRLEAVRFRVKAPVTRRPPHRSGREGFPHPVP